MEAELADMYVRRLTAREKLVDEESISGTAFLSSSKGLLARTGALKSKPTALGLAYSLKLLIEGLGTC
jgi:hypothetical protein